MSAAASAAVGVALALDAAVGEFPGRVHPVAAFGRVVAALDREWSHPRAVGVVLAACLPVAAGGLVAGGVLLAAGVHPAAAAGVAGLALFSTTSLRMLLSVSHEVIERSAVDVAGARERVGALVGRDASSLSPADLRSAAVESAAENLVDGLVAPLAAFAVLAPVGIPAAAGGAAWVKGVNTLDSMLGYRSRPLGWASARLDDAVMWVPARLGAVALAVAGRSPGGILRARPSASAPPSPNSGWPMATLAVTLDVRLRKPGVYVLNDGGDCPDLASGRRAVRLVGVAGVLAFSVAGVIAWF